MMSLAVTATTRLGDRLWMTLAMLALLALIYLAMWRAWHRPDPVTIGALPEVPENWLEQDRQKRICAECIYASTTLSGRWMQRLRAHGLGERARGLICVGEAGILIQRDGATDLFIPRGSVRGVSFAPGIAGKVVGGKGVVVISWQMEGVLVDTGVLPDLALRAQILSAGAELIHG